MTERPSFVGRVRQQATWRVDQWRTHLPLAPGIGPGTLVLMPGEAHERLLTPSEAAAMLGIKFRTLSAWAAAGRAPCAARTPGGHRRFSLADVEAMRVQLGRPSAEPQPPKARPVSDLPSRRLLTSTEVAAALDVADRTVRRWADTGVLPPAVRTPGGHGRWRRSDVERLAVEHGLWPARTG